MELWVLLFIDGKVLCEWEDESCNGLIYLFVIGVEVSWVNLCFDSFFFMIFFFDEFLGRFFGYDFL